MAPTRGSPDYEARLDLTERIRSLVVENSGISFKAGAFEKLCGPIVYLFLRHGEPQYVGMSRRGLSRPGSGNHHKALTRATCDEVMVWGCPSARAAIELERILIGALRPAKNGGSWNSFVRERLGMRRVNAKKVVESMDAAERDLAVAEMNAGRPHGIPVKLIVRTKYDLRGLMGKKRSG